MDKRRRSSSSSSREEEKKADTIVVNISDTQYPIIRDVCKNIFHWKLQTDKEGTGWDLFWTDNAVQTETLSKMQPHQKINHFPGMFSLARKNNLARGLSKMRKKFG